MPYIGSRVKRKEDVRLLRGIGKYVGDIHRAGMVHAAILRSTHPHARIVKIDAAPALKLPGVVGVLTAADMPGLKTIPMRTGVIPGLERSQQSPIATTKVRYVGDPVAVVVAENRYIAEDALDRKSTRLNSSHSKQSRMPSSACCDWSSDVCSRSEEHTSELQSQQAISYAVFCLL